MAILDSLLQFAPSEEVGQAIKTLPRFNFTNVATFFFQDKKEHWTPKDILYPRPPFNALWYECKMPKSAFSEEVGRTDFSIPGYEVYSFGVSIKAEDTYTLIGSLAIFKEHGPDREKPVHISKRYTLSYTINSEGFPCILGNSTIDNWYFFAPILLGFSFSACRNIEIIRVETSPALNKSRIRKGKAPIKPYHVINILPFGKVFSRSSRTVVSDDGKIDVQIRRGSYARYGPTYNKGLLFGKYEGMFWRPATLKDFSKQQQEYKVKV